MDGGFAECGDIFRLRKRKLQLLPLHCASHQSRQRLELSLTWPEN